MGRDHRERQNAQNQNIQYLVNYLFIPFYIQKKKKRKKKILRWKNSCGSPWEDYVFEAHI